MRYKKYFYKFIKMLDKRLEKGFEEYGDKSFDRSEKDLIEEIEEELLDVAGWSVILFAKIQGIKEKLK